MSFSYAADILNAYLNRMNKIKLTIKMVQLSPVLSVTVNKLNTSKNIFSL